MNYFNIPVRKSNVIKNIKRIKKSFIQSDWTFDQKLLPNDILTSHNGQTIQKTNKEWKCAFIQQVFNQGIQTWSLRIDKYEVKDKSGIIFGVVEEKYTK